MSAASWASSMLFQSTLPVRGATRSPKNGRCNKRNFNPRSPCGERLACRVPFISPPSVFQSTLPVRGATQVHQVVVAAQIFQSTLPVRGATTALSTQSLTATISIHAPRAGSDYSTYCNIMLISYFNPRSPCGERRANIGNIGNHRVFQSTLPVRGATEHNMKR